MDSDRQIAYEIRIEGLLDPEWSGWFDGLVVTRLASHPPVTILVGVMDQSALRGLLSRLWDLNLTLISVVPCWDEGLGYDLEVDDV